MTQQVPRTHPPAFVEAVEGDFECEGAALRVQGFVQQARRLGVRGGPDHVLQGTVEVPVQERDGSVEGVREHGEGGVQFLPHTRPLGSLPGEEEGRPTLPNTSLVDVLVRSAVHVGGQSPYQLFAVPTHDRHPVGQPRAPGRQ